MLNILPTGALQEEKDKEVKKCTREDKSDTLTIWLKKRRERLTLVNENSVRYNKTLRY